MSGRLQIRLCGSTSRSSECPHAQVSVCRCTPAKPSLRFGRTAVVCMASPQMGQAGACGLMFLPSRAATRSSSSFTRFGSAETIFHSGI